MRFYKMVRLLSFVKNPGMEPLGMILHNTVICDLVLFLIMSEHVVDEDADGDGAQEQDGEHHHQH